MFHNFIIVLLSVGILNAEDNVVKDLKFSLQSGDQMPMIGFGTARINGVVHVREVLDDALGAGYRLFDTAAVYRNEEDIGKALKELLPKHNLARKDIFITSKLDFRADTYGEHAYKALQDSLERLGLDYLDLYLIHHPDFSNPPSGFNFSQARDETWKVLIRGQKDGLVRNIGVSNYKVDHLQELLNNDHGVKPAVDQVEWHPEHHSDDLLNLCKKEGIALQAFFSFGFGQELLQNEEVKKIATRLGKTPGQVLLRWAVQQNILVIPKSRGRKHQEENLNLNFEISESDMKILSSFKQKEDFGGGPRYRPGKLGGVPNKTK